VPKAGQQALAASSAVDVTYARPGPAPTFDMDHQLFADNLVAQLAGQTVGYEYAIYQGQTLKRSGAGGYAVRSSALMSPDRRISIGSTSKTITAAAVMRAIEILKAKGKNVSIDSPIAPYLPATWPQGAHVSEIKIKDLLRHTSGLRTGADTYEDLVQVIAAGASADNWAARNDSFYCNSNFTLFRIILPYMLYGHEPFDHQSNPELEAQIRELQEDLATAAPNQKPAIIAQIKALQAQKAPAPGEDIAVHLSKRYVEFVQTEVLAKVGLGNVWINPRGAAEAIGYYNTNDPDKVFGGYADAEAVRGVGAGFWFMSAKELGKFIGGLRAGKIISAASYQAMTANRLGLWIGGSDSGGTFWHNGAFDRGDAGPGLRGAWVTFPNGVTAVVFYNSTNWKIVNGAIARADDGKPVEAIPAPQAIITNAYNAAIALQPLQP
jgi:CubicO group peptidase (beta-lactamase class C family)